jgi:hypothetical protein
MRGFRGRNPSLTLGALWLLVAACTPDARSPSGGYGAGYGGGPIGGDDSLRAPPAAAAPSSSSATTFPDVSRCFVDQARHGWVKLRVHLTADGRVQKVEDEGSTADVAVIECAMRVVAEGGYSPCNGCGHYEHHVELEVLGVPAEAEGAAEADAGPGSVVAPMPVPGAPLPARTPPPDGGTDDHWM